MGFVPIFALAVPIFFAISGFFAGRPPTPGEGPRAGLFRLRRRLARLAVPFLVWNVILLGLSPERTLLPPGEILFFLGTGYWQLYYVFALFQLLLLGVLLEPLMHGRRMNWILAGAGILSFLFYGISDLLLWTQGADGGFFEALWNRFFAGWSLFFATGIVLRRLPGALEGLSRNLARFFLLSAFFYLAYLAELHFEDRWLGYHPRKQFLLAGLPFQFFGTLAFIGALFRFQGLPRGQRVLARLASLGGDTFGIYLAHTGVLMVFYRVMLASGRAEVHWIEAPVLWAATWIFSTGFVRLVRDVPAFGRVGFILFGFRARR
jgi:surface polysaccharide O-acyltransferase-like enzyme